MSSPNESFGRWTKQIFRVATLIVPAWLAWFVAFSEPHPDELTSVVKLVLGPMWGVLVLGMVIRIIAVIIDRKNASSSQLLARIDLLTAGGSALAWLSSFALMGAVWLGWASLAVVGMLGSALFHIIVLYTLLVVRSVDPMRIATVKRRFVPETATEGDDVIEELRLVGTRIPLGFRLFASGRVGSRWAESRYVIEGAEAGGEIQLESKIGPAIRGEHDAEPLELWLQDTFGLCRSVRVKLGAPRLTVLPRLRQAEQVEPLMARGDGPRAPRPMNRMPTEGNFRLREYQEGDDVRRIHWVRSLASRQLIVRLPDELPPDQPQVRLVLDTFFPEADVLACDTPGELLDSVVATWLAIARSLAETGVRVTLVTLVPRDEGSVAVSQPFSAHNPAAALRLGAQVEWQSRIMADALLTDEETFVVSRAAVAGPHPYDKARWIIVLPTAILAEPAWNGTSGLRWRFPMGSSDNRWTRGRREADRVAVARRDRARTLAMRPDMVRPPPGSFMAIPPAATPDGNESARPIRVEPLR